MSKQSSLIDSLIRELQTTIIPQVADPCLDLLQQKVMPYLAIYILTQIIIIALLIFLVYLHHK
jgi:hypothetical protein